MWGVFGLLLDLLLVGCFFFFNDTATTEIYTLSLHDALPICGRRVGQAPVQRCHAERQRSIDRKSTRLNSSHHSISYAVFCLKKKKKEPVDTVKRKHDRRTKKQAREKRRR